MDEVKLEEEDWEICQLDQLRQHQESISAQVRKIREELSTFRDTSRLWQKQLLMELSKNYEKMMDGFRAIERAFKLNCSAQMQFSDELAEHAGVLTQDPWAGC